MKLVFATHNRGKLQEIKMLLPSNIGIISLDDLHCNEEIEETADTLEGNAIIKARYIKQKYGFDCFADDSGLEVEALNGAPGVYSARYAGPEQIAENNMAKLLHEMKDATNRKACFKTVIALIYKGKEYYFEGVIQGEITPTKEGTKGFGYDPVFKPFGYTHTFAQMDITQKNNISHRALAVNKLVDFLKQDNL
jgi:XTP/dITP diphosphohydrolase